MAMNQSGSLKYFTFNMLDKHPLHHGIFCRDGGVSPDPWRSLNLGGTNGDSRDNVIENRYRIFSVFQLPVESIFDVWQVHGTQVICTDQPRKLNEAHLQADAILTNVESVTLFMRFADCVPLFFYDPKRQVIGIGHAGWRGTLEQIGKRIVDEMVSRYACRRSDVIVGIGPSIGADHYQVGESVIDLFKSKFLSKVDEIFLTKGDHTYLDLWKANEITLRQAGVEMIEVSSICTGCHVEDWYSHRLENGKTGRFGALFSLRRD